MSGGIWDTGSADGASAIGVSFSSASSGCSSFFVGVAAGLDSASGIEIDCDLELCRPRFVPLVGVSVGVIGRLISFETDVLAAPFLLLAVVSVLAFL